MYMIRDPINLFEGKILPNLGTDSTSLARPVGFRAATISLFLKGSITIYIYNLFTLISSL